METKLPTAAKSEIGTGQPSLLRRLTLFDGIMLLVGGIIGSGIFLTAAEIAGEVRTPGLFIAVWVLGGLISLLACFAFAELGSMFPNSGGQYVFLREAYGDLPAFLYGWMIFTVAQTGTIAALAVAFAEYLARVVPLDYGRVVFSLGVVDVSRGQVVALAAILALTTVNVFGVRRGADVVNLATVLKFAAIAAFVILGFAIGTGSWENLQTPMAPVEGRSLIAALGVALIAVFWTYDGWIYITYVAGEVKDPQRNVPRTLIFGILIVTAVYLAMNLTYLYALPMAQIAEHVTVAQAAAASMFSPSAAQWLSLVVAVSCFGAASAAVLSGGRVYYAMAQDRVFFQRMAVVHPRWRTPAFSLIIQGLWAGALALTGTYDQLFTYVIFMMVLSYVASVVGLFVMRRTRPDHPRPYRCTGYPWIPGIYVVFAALWALNALVERPLEALAGIGIVLLGVPGYIYWKRQQNV